IAAFDIRHGVGAALAADQQRVALRVVARVGRLGVHTDETTIGVLRFAGADALGDDPRAGVLAQVDHLGAGVGLLEIVGDGDRVELAHRVVAAQDAAGIFPGDGRARLDLGPADLRAVAAAVTALGHEVVDAAQA